MFGSCPECGHEGTYVNRGKEHWFYCEKHKVKWRVGRNLMSTWQNETEEQQREQWAALGLDSFMEISLEAAGRL